MAILMSLMYTILKKLSRVQNQKRNTINLKLVVARVFTLKNLLVLESASNNTTDYPNKEFIDASDEDDTTQGEDNEDEGDEFVCDHVVGDQDDEEEEEVERVELEGSKYEVGDD